MSCFAKTLLRKVFEKHNSFKNMDCYETPIKIRFELEYDEVSRVPFHLIKAVAGEDGKFFTVVRTDTNKDNIRKLWRKLKRVVKDSGRTIEDEDKNSFSITLQ